MPKIFLQKYNLLHLDREPIYSYLKFEKIGTALINRVHSEINGNGIETIEVDKVKETIEFWSLDEKSVFIKRINNAMENAKKKFEKKIKK